MYKTLTLLALFVSGFLVSCDKDDTVVVHPPVPNPPPSYDDKAVIFVKDVVEQGLPSPYFHFAYNDSGYATNISFADGFYDYNVSYTNKRVAFMVNKKNNARLDYQYTNGRATAIKQTLAGQPLWVYKMSYNQNKLTEVQWYRFLTTGDSVLERKVELFYRADENLSSYKNWTNNNGVLKLTSTYVFSQYDEGINVDDFYLFKTFFEDLIFLPGIKLQKNNPGLVQIFGDNNDFEIKYLYTYRDDMPQQKHGIFKQTRGGNGAETFLSTTYSYY